MASLDQFAKRIRTIAIRAEENVDKTVRKCALAIDRVVVMETPVDTGRARSNWIAALDATPPQAIGAYAPGEAGSTSGANAQAALDQAASVIDSYDGDSNSSIHITNNLSYIGKLNEGSSAQAPAGYVEAGVQAGVSVVRGARVIDVD